MNTKDITEREFETLKIVEALKKLIDTDEQYWLSSLDDMVYEFTESDNENIDEFIEDLFELAKAGYIKTAGVEDGVPVVEDITMQGVEILQNWGKETSEKTTIVNNITNNVTNNTNVVNNNTVNNNTTNKNYSLINEANASVVGGVEASLIDNPLVEVAGKALKGVVDKVTKKS